MYRKVVVAAVSVLVLLSLAALAGCSGKEERIRASWITVKMNSNLASVSLNEVKNNRISHFKMGTPAGDLSFMAYELGGKIYARADICPPCRSQSFSLQGNTLVCDACNTVFDAKTGGGVSGACVNYPKAEVPYSLNSDQMVMKGDDLVNAYRETLKPVP